VTSHHLAELNVGTLKYPLDDPRMIDFTANLAPINALAERSPGYVWRLVDDSAVSATSLRPLGADVIINLSVWTDVESLRDYVFRSGHLDFLRRRTDWFERPRPGEPSTVLWWLPAGQLPTVDDAVRRLQSLRRHGSTPQAFSFREVYPPAVAEMIS
jgi:hypothetical protein